MDNFSEIKVGDYIKYDVGAGIYREARVGTVVRVTSSMFYINEHLRFRKSDGKMIGTQYRYATHATQADVDAFNQKMRAEIRMYLRSSLEDMPYEKLEDLHKHLFGDGKNSNTNSLIKISTYAKKEGLSVPAVYKRINAGTLKCVEIDGVKFIDRKNEKDRD